MEMKWTNSNNEIKSKEVNEDDYGNNKENRDVTRMQMTFFRMTN